MTSTPTQSPEPSAAPTLAASASAPASQAPASPSAIPPAAPGGRIAFVRREVDDDRAVADVWVVWAEGIGLEQLTHDARFEGGLVWAPDGSRLYYESERIFICGDSYCFANRVFSVLPDGSDRRDHGRIGSFGPATKGVVSPNHRFVAYGGEDGADPIQAMIIDRTRVPRDAWAAWGPTFRGPTFDGRLTAAGSFSWASSTGSRSSTRRRARRSGTSTTRVSTAWWAGRLTAGRSCTGAVSPVRRRTKWSPVSMVRRGW